MTKKMHNFASKMNVLVLKNLFFSSPACVAGCDFDFLDNLCGWVTDQDAGLFGFEQFSGRGPTTGTGPQDDFSKPGRESSFFTGLKKHATLIVSGCLVVFILCTQTLTIKSSGCRTTYGYYIKTLSTYNFV